MCLLRSNMPWLLIPVSMSQPRKLIFWSAIGLLLLFILAPVIGQFIPLHLESPVRDYYEGARAIAIPVCILLTLSGTLGKGDGTAVVVAKVFITLIVVVISFLVLVMLAFADMCEWSTGKVLFQNKKNPSSQIVLRSYGCGATDSTSPLYEVCEIYRIGGGLILTYPADTTRIDHSRWLRVSRDE